MFKLPKAIICNDAAVKAKIVEYGIDPSKVFPIPAFSVQYLERGAGRLPATLEGFYTRFHHLIFSYIRLRPLFYPIELVEGFAELAAARPDVGLLLCGAVTDDHGEEGLLRQTRDVIETRNIRDRVAIVDDLDHDAFMEALGRSTLYLRSHVSDGVCSSVLEALTLGVPVVASDNGTRPPGVIVYPATDPHRLAEILAGALEHRESLVRSIERPPVTDTLRTEADLLVSIASD